jgi:hypothetical protein
VRLRPYFLAWSPAAGTQQPEAAGRRARAVGEDRPEMISVKWPSGARGWLLRPVSPRPSILILVPHRKRLSGQRRASQAIFPGMVPSGRHTATGGRRTTSESSRRRPSRDDFCQVAFWRTRLASEAGISATQYSDTRATPKAALRPTSCVSGHISWHGPQRQAHSNRRPPDDEREQSAKTVPR